MINHIIVGYGKWAKKILSFLVKYKIAQKLVVIRRKKKFIYYPKYKRLKESEFKSILKQCKSAHICSSDSTHLKYFNFFSKNKLQFIIEKPLVNNKKEFSKLLPNKKSKYLVNYIDLYNNELTKIIKILNKNKNKNINLNIIYSDNSHQFKKRNLLIHSWLDHPLALILFFKKKFSNFKIKKYRSIRNKKAKYTENIMINYNYGKTNINFVITNVLKKKRLIEIGANKKKYLINLNKNKSFKETNFYRLYKNLNHIEKSDFRFNLLFHKKILLEKEKIFNVINK